MKDSHLHIRLTVLFCGMAATASVLYFNSQDSLFTQTKTWRLEKRRIAEAMHLGESLHQGTFHQNFPETVEVDVFGKPKKATLSYTIDEKLQSETEKLIKSYKPDYAAVVAIDPDTGKILLLVSYSKLDQINKNLALRASFPAASVFKLITAAAAFDHLHLHSESTIDFNGSNHTLYRKNVLGSKQNRWTRTMTMREAFAKSVNTVFGKIGAFTVGRDTLRDYANRFGFDQDLQVDLPLERGRALIPTDPFPLAEAASGYTRNITMSPLQGAVMAATIANHGIAMEPYVVSHAKFIDGSEPDYVAEPKMVAEVIGDKAVDEIRELMEETVKKGTSSKSFRGFFKKKNADIQVGGKTGSLTGKDPPGKYDWFVSYAMRGSKKIAISTLMIHQKQWVVKSSYIARRVYESYFR